MSEVKKLRIRVKNVGVSTGVPNGDLVGEGLCFALVPRAAGGAVAPTAPGLGGSASFPVIPGVEGPCDASGLGAPPCC